LVRFGGTVVLVARADQALYKAKVERNSVIAD